MSRENRWWRREIGWFSDRTGSQLTTGKRAERIKHDFRCSICRSAIGQASCLICTRRRQLTFPFCCQISLLIVFCFFRLHVSVFIDILLISFSFTTKFDRATSLDHWKRDMVFWTFIKAITTNVLGEVQIVYFPCENFQEHGNSCPSQPLKWHALPGN